MCSFQHGVDVGSVGSRGLTFEWKQHCIVSLKTFSDSHIDVLVKEDADGKCWRCTRFYGALGGQRTVDSWNLL